MYEGDPARSADGSPVDSPDQPPISKLKILANSSLRAAFALLLRPKVAEALRSNAVTLERIT